jgi:hypothetical protein
MAVAMTAFQAQEPGPGAGRCVRDGPGAAVRRVGASGFGRIHRADGLREFTRAKAITSRWMKPPMNLTSFGRTDADLRRTVGLIRLLHGRRGRSGQSAPG